MTYNMRVFCNFGNQLCPCDVVPTKDDNIKNKIMPGRKSSSDIA